MTSTDIDRVLRPIGVFQAPTTIDRAQVQAWIDDIARLPADVRRFAEALDEEQLATSYRPGGWSVRQVLHHIPDSHMNSYVRFKWALTEERPRIKPYDEVAWAELPEASSAPVGVSLDLLDALHARWVLSLESMSEDDLRREFDHPESGPARLDWNIGNYAWHGRHHLAQITALAEREGWKPA